jgi:hypothetical protein
MRLPYARIIALPKCRMIRHDSRMTQPLSGEQFWRSWRIALGQSGVWHLAVFLGGLPSKRQEIDDKLQSNSR